MKADEDVQNKSIKHSRTFFDISIDGEAKGRIVFELYDEHAPKTVENFRALCTGEKGKEKSGKPLHYKDCKFHRIIPKFMIQSGDFLNGDGTGNESIYGGKFDDESFRVRHNAPGLLSMANSGKNTNGSQFFITTAATDWLNGHHVVFGKVVQGMNAVKEIESKGSTTGEPSADVRIVDCGALESVAYMPKEKGDLITTVVLPAESAIENRNLSFKILEDGSLKVEGDTEGLVFEMQNI